MKISEFQEWAKGKGFINPVVEDERVPVEPRKPNLGFAHKTRKTGNTLHTFVAVSGRVVTVLCGEEGVIKKVNEGEGEIHFM